LSGSPIGDSPGRVRAAFATTSFEDVMTFATTLVRVAAPCLLAGAAHASPVPAADPAAPVPRTDYRPAAAYRSAAPEPASPDLAWREQNRIVGAQDSMMPAMGGAAPDAHTAHAAHAGHGAHAGHAASTAAPGSGPKAAAMSCCGEEGCCCKEGGCCGGNMAAGAQSCAPAAPAPTASQPAAHQHPQHHQHGGQP
jgi:hypothetical protein